MTYLELVQMTLREAGITQSVTEPQSLTGLTGLAAKVRGWVAQAWEDIKTENDQSELTREWFSTSIRPRVYFDLGFLMAREPTLSKLIGQTSGATLYATKTIITNGGSFGNRTAEGYIEFESLVGTPFPNEIFLGPVIPPPPPVPGAPVPVPVRKGFRFLRFGDYKLDSAIEMGTGQVANLDDLWWDTLSISDDPQYGGKVVREQPLKYIDYSRWSKNFDTNVLTVGTPRLVTEMPSDGARVGLYPPPDRPYLLSGYYYKTIPPLVVDKDEPQGLKEKYHPMIAWRALSYYGQYELQANVVQQAATRYAVFKKKFDRESEIPVSLRSAPLY